MLHREEQLRMCNTTKESYKIARYYYGEQGVTNIIINIQKQVSREYDIEENEGMYMLRSVEYIFEDDKDFLSEIKNISHYRKYNILVDGNINIGDKVPDINIYHLKSGIDIPLLDNNSRYQVIFSGSIT